MTTQEQVNICAQKLRMAVIVFLLQNDLLSCNATKSVDEDELQWRAKKIYAMPCCTAQLKRLFNDCHELRRERGQFPAPVSVIDLEYCLKNRSIGYRSSQQIKLSWLPKKEDRELRCLEEFRNISAIYQKLIANGQKIIAPQTQPRICAEAEQIINKIHNQLTA